MRDDPLRKQPFDGLDDFRSCDGHRQDLPDRGPAGSPHRGGVAVASAVVAAIQMTKAGGAIAAPQAYGRS